MKRWKDKTRGGYDVRIYAQDGKPELPIHAAIRINGEWISKVFSPNGECFGDMNGYDLVPEEPAYAEKIVIEAVRFHKNTNGEISICSWFHVDESTDARQLIGRRGRLTFEPESEE